MITTEDFRIAYCNETLTEGNSFIIRFTWYLAVIADRNKVKIEHVC